MGEEEIHMEKKACIDLLNQKGYLTQEADGVVTVQLGELSEKERKQKMDEIAELIKAKGYTGSYGFRWKNDAAAGKKGSTQKEDDFDFTKAMDNEITEKGQPAFDLEESGEGQMSFFF